MNDPSDSKRPRSGKALISISQWVDAHLYFVRTTLSLAAVGGLVLIAYSTGLHKCYRSSIEIAPSEFIRRSKLRVHVRQIAAKENTPLLVVDHRPFLWRLFRLRQPESDGLYIRLAGIDIQGNGTDWLRDHLQDRMATIQLLARTNPENILESHVFYTKSWYKQRQDVALHLLYEGFGTARPITPYNAERPIYAQNDTKYLQKCISAETYAQKYGKGIWKGAAPSASLQIREKAEGVIEWVRRKIGL